MYDNLISKVENTARKDALTSGKSSGLSFRAGKRLVKVFALCTALCIALLFSHSSFAKVDLLYCSTDGINKYKKLEELMKRSSKVFLLHSMGVTALCIGKHDIGLGYLQRASDAGYIASTHLLGVYI